MPVFGTIDSLQHYIVNVTLPEIIVPVQSATEEKLNYRVEENLYRNAPLNNNFYINTFGLFNSAESYAERFGSGVVNTGMLISTFLNPKGEYPAYYGGASQKDNIVEYLDQGHTGFFKGVAIDYEGKEFFKDATKDLLKGGFLKRAVSDYLKGLGYIISRSSNK